MAWPYGLLGIAIFPSIAALSCGLGGKSITIWRALMRSVRYNSRRACIALSSIFSGCNCSSIHLSTPTADTLSASPGRGPNVRRSSACTARRCSSATLDSLGLFFAKSTAATDRAARSPATQKRILVIAADLPRCAWLEFINRNGGESCLPCLGWAASLEKLAQISETLHLQQAAIRRVAPQLVALQRPGLVVRNEDRVQACFQCRIDIGLRAIPNHPRDFGYQGVLLHDGAIDSSIFLGNHLDCSEVFLQTRPLHLPLLFGEIAFGNHE